MGEGEIFVLVLVVVLVLERSFANAQLVEWSDRLEGSRFVAWQLYRLAAGGSRERLDARQFYGPFYPHSRIEAMGKT